MAIFIEKGRIVLSKKLILKRTLWMHLSGSQQQTHLRYICSHPQR